MGAASATHRPTTPPPHRFERPTIPHCHLSTARPAFPPLPNSLTTCRPNTLTPYHGTTQSNGTPRADDFNEMLLKRRTEIGLCIENNAALVIDGDKFKVINTDGKARVLKKTVEGGEVVEERIGGPGSFESIDWE